MTLMPPPPGEPWPPPAVSPETGHAVGHPMNTRRVNRIRRAAGIRRCWLFHRWRHVNFIGLAFLVEHQRCARCGYERCVQVVP